MEFKNQCIMKQPELGKKILELRKLKGLTQEELVEKCNINVRTIQRIEAGDVSPRSYTIKAILDVLGFGYSEIFEEKYTSGKFDSFLGIKKERIYKQLSTAMIFGIILFTINFLRFGLISLYFKEDGFEDNFKYKMIFTLFKIASIISLFLFYRGFVIIGVMFKNYLLQISCMLIIIFSIVLSFLDVGALFWLDGVSNIISLSKAITFGVLSIVLGISIKRLSDLGNLSKWTGILEIITGVCLLSFVLVPLSLVFQAVVEIFEIILLYRVVSSFKKDYS